MNNLSSKPYSKELQSKIDKSFFSSPLKIGEVAFSNPILLAPMASICNAPYRLLMQELGAGGSASELVSCDGIIHGNKRTLDMLRIDKAEKNIGIQLFGENELAMAKGAEKALEFGPDFIDINMGCPVRKVVNKGGGSALMKETAKLPEYFREVKKACGDIPLTIKIRTGWDDENINAEEVCRIAKGEGIEMVAIHGRTRAQQYTGSANWNFIESLADKNIVPLIGNGDLHQPHQVKERLGKTNCTGLMIARGCVRNPFIFLESNPNLDAPIRFNASDYYEVIERYADYVTQWFDRDSIQLVQTRKLIMWFANGFMRAGQFRSRLFEWKSLEDTMRYSEDYFKSLGTRTKQIDYNQSFMTSGHG